MLCNTKFTQYIGKNMFTQKCNKISTKKKFTIEEKNYK